MRNLGLRDPPVVKAVWVTLFLTLLRPSHSIFDKHSQQRHRPKHPFDGLRRSYRTSDSKPKHFLIPSSPIITAFTGNSLLVSCKREVGITESLVWRSPNGTRMVPLGRIHSEIIPPNKPTNILTSDLIFNSIHSKDSGKYSCCSTNYDCNTNRSFLLQVHNSFNFSDTNTTQNIIEGSNASVICSVFPNPKIIIWYKNGELLRNRNFTTKPGYLQIVNASTEDQGRYVCEAIRVTNELSISRSITILLHIHSKPRWINKPGPQRFKNPNNTLAIYCEAQSFPKPNITWLKGNHIPLSHEPFSPESVVHVGDRSTLSITNLEYNTSHIYICIAQNYLGKLTATVQVTDLKLKPPHPIINIMKITSTQLVIKLWLSKQPTNPMSGYKLTLTKGEQLLNSFLVPSNPYTITHLMPNTTYILNVSARTRAGFASDPTKIKVTTKTYDHSMPALANSNNSVSHLAFSVVALLIILTD